MANSFAESAKSPRWAQVFLPEKQSNINLPLANRSDWERVICEHRHFVIIGTWRQNSAKEISELCVVPYDVICARMQ